MTFAHLERLPLLAVWLCVALWWLRGLGRRLAAWRALGGSGPPLTDRAWAKLLALGTLVFALAEPRWGRQTEPPSPPGRDVVLLIDVSRSMAAEDAVPNRLAVAKQAAEGLVRALGDEPGSRAAVIAFAGAPVVRCGLTENLGAVVDVIRSLRPGEVQPGGTSLSAALDLAFDSFDHETVEHAEGRIVVLFSDGEDHSNVDAAAIASRASAKTIVHALAIGDSEQGHPIPVGPDSAPLRHLGRTVETKRRDQTLRAIAEATGGVFIPLGLASTDLAALYRSKIEPVESKVRLERRPHRFAERFPLFLSLSAGFLLWGFMPRTLWRRGHAPLSALVVATFALGATDPVSVSNEIDRGRSFYRAGRFEEARLAFDRVYQSDPKSALARFDLAAALFQLGRIDEAEVHYQKARASADSRLRTKIDYAIGNCRLVAGDPQGAIVAYDRCLDQGSTASSLASTRDDARVNRAYARQRLERPQGSEAGQGPGDSADKKSSEKPESPPPDEKASTDPGQSAPSKGADPGEPTPKAPGGGASGGAGGSSANGEKSAERRLEEAVEAIRQAKRARLPDSPSPNSDDPERKDW